MTLQKPVNIFFAVVTKIVTPFIPFDTYDVKREREREERDSERDREREKDKVRERSGEGWIDIKMERE